MFKKKIGIFWVEIKYFFCIGGNGDSPRLHHHVPASETTAETTDTGHKVKMNDSNRDPREMKGVRSCNIWLDFLINHWKRIICCCWSGKKDLQQRNLFAAVDQEKDEQLQQLSKDRANLQHKISAVGALVSSLVKPVSFSFNRWCRGSVNISFGSGSAEP